MIVVDERVAEVVVLVGELDGGNGKLRALFHAVTLGETARRHVADDDFEGNNLHLFHEGIAVTEFLDEMSGDALLFEHSHHHIAHLVVDDALARDGTLFEPVERGRVVLVRHDDEIGVVGGIHFFGLAFVNLFEFFHNTSVKTESTAEAMLSECLHATPPARTLALEARSSDRDCAEFGSTTYFMRLY